MSTSNGFSSSTSGNAIHVVVVGAGIVGVSTATWLQRAGLNVTLVDRSAPGEGTSHGNAGILASCSMVPVTTPGLVAKAPGMLFDRDFPLYLKWSYLPTLLPWLREYLGNANDQDTQRIATHLSHIVGDSVDQHFALAGNTAAGKWLVPSDYCFAYNDRAAFDKEAYVWKIRERAGFVPRLLEGAAIRDFDPAYGEQVKLLAVLDNHGHVTSPGGYVKSLAEVFVASGGTLTRADVTGFRRVDGRVKAVLTQAGELSCTHAVVTAGVWSKHLEKELGIRIPMESERGYHVIFKNPGIKLKTPTMVSSGKFVATPMADGIRCAGIVEFGGLEAGPSRKPIELLKRHVRHVLPDLSQTDNVEWLGHRPATVDSLPLIGEVGQTGIYTGFGHQHIGLTAGAKTGRMLSDLITGECTRESLAAYRPDRFS